MLRKARSISLWLRRASTPSTLAGRTLRLLPGVGAVIAAGVASAALASVAVGRNQATSDATPVLRRDDWVAAVSGGQALHEARGNDTIVVFTDFQCPYCRALAITLADLRATRRATVHVVLRQFPLHKVHPHATAAAVAAVCAGHQRRLEPFHDYVFAHQEAIPRLDWDAIASEIGVPEPIRFAECRGSIEARRAIMSDIAIGNRLNVLGTPTVLVNGRRLAGPPTLAQIERALRRPR